MATVLLSSEGVDAPDGLKEDAEALLVAARCEDCELSLVVCNDAWIRALNKQWRDKDTATDVLSFPQQTEVVLGDLVISLDTSRRQADERGHSLQDEVRVLLVHGLLHLLGSDHETGDEDLQEMAAAERTLLDRLSWRGEGLITTAIT